MHQCSILFKGLPNLTLRLQIKVSRNCNQAAQNKTPEAELVADALGPLAEGATSGCDLLLKLWLWLGCTSPIQGPCPEFDNNQIQK